MPSQIGYFDKLKSAAGKVFDFLSSITLTGTDGKTITCTQDTSLDEAVAMSSKAPKANAVLTGTTTAEILNTTGSTIDMPTATPTTLFAAADYSMYLVAVYGQELGADYNATAIVLHDGTGKNLIGYQNGAKITITMSGVNVQVTHTRGSNADIVWRSLRIK